MQITAFLILVFFIGWLIWHNKKKKENLPIFPKSFVTILEEKVGFYRLLDEPDKCRFQKRMMRFLNRVRITGVNTIVADEDKVFIAAGAIIPIFSFENWEYTNLNEVLLYLESFSEEFDTRNENDRPVLGMIGDGPMQHVMILSQPSLREVFINDTGKSNTAIHEFVHLIDKTDGAIDGIPENLLSKQYTIPWINMMHQMLKEMLNGNSDINPYGATNQGEFFAVVSEYFFERPDLLQSKHPGLYELLEKIFNTDPNKPPEK